MTRNEWAEFARGLRALQGDWVPDDLDAAYDDLWDVPLDEAQHAARASRLLGAETASGPAIRREWVDLVIQAPEAVDAAAEIREVFLRHRQQFGSTLGDEKAHEELATSSPLLAEVARVFGGPPPAMLSERIKRWDPTYVQVVERAKRTRLLSRRRSDDAFAPLAA